MSGNPKVESVELLLFEVGGRRFATEAAAVLEITGQNADAFVLAELGARASEVPSVRRDRALGFMGSEGTRRALAVDTVIGVRKVKAEALRRLPPAAFAHPWVLGLWIDPDPPVVLIDLQCVDARAPTKGDEENVPRNPL